MRHSNIHTHTVFSDGKNTMREMIERAIDLDFASLGFSDHSETVFFSEESMKEDRYATYRAQARDMKKEYEGAIEVFCGIEMDYCSDLDPDDFDYVIGSVHYLPTPDSSCSPVDFDLEHQMKHIHDFCKGKKEEYAKIYYDTLVRHAQKTPYQVQGHFDLLNKFGLFDDEGETYRHLALEALDEILAITPFIEMNTGAIARGCRNAPYPAPFLLQRILEKKGKVILNGDSHHIDHLNCHYEASVELLKKIGFSSLWQLRETGFEEVLI